MKTTVILLVVIILLLATFSPDTFASAGGGGGGTYRFKGLGANAFFSSLDPSGCVSTDVYVYASEQMVKDQPGSGNSSSGVSIFISQYDFCTGTQLLAADGYTSLAAPDLEVAKKLDAAALKATVSMYDYISGNWFDVAVGVNWAGTSAIGQQSNQSLYRFEGCHQKYQNKSTFRWGQATGSISDGATQFAAGTSVNADVYSSKGGSVSVGCV